MTCRMFIQQKRYLPTTVHCQLKGQTSTNKILNIRRRRHNKFPLKQVIKKINKSQEMADDKTYLPRRNSRPDKLVRDDLVNLVLIVLG